MIQPITTYCGAHRRVMCRPSRVVRVLMAGEATAHGLPRQSRQQVRCVLPPGPIRQKITSQIGQAEHVTKFTICQQPGVGGDAGALEFQPQAAVELHLQQAVICFTRWVFNDHVGRLPTAY